MRFAGRVVQVVKPLPLFYLGFGILLFGWVVFLVLVAAHLIESGQGRLLVLPAILVFAMAGCIMMPLNSINYLLEPLDSLVATAHAAYPDWTMFHFTAGKLGHTLCFALFTLITLVLKSKFRMTWLQLISIVCLLALATEGLQLFLSDRTTRLTDLGMDAAGVGLGIGVFAGFTAIKVGLLPMLPIQRANQQSDSDGEPETR